MKKTAAAILAHVDAGKTTCIEAMLFNAGRIRKMGRVDHGDTVLDFDEQERQHGITIYAKETWFPWKQSEIYILDTPGHVDFSSELERTLSVIDIAVVLISAQEGVQAHTITIWKCLEHYGIPCIFFVNKMDLCRKSESELMAELNEKCSDACVNFNAQNRQEQLAVLSDRMLDLYEKEGEIPSEVIVEAVSSRRCFPVFFGSALKNDGVRELMDALDGLTGEKKRPEEFGAKVFGISQDSSGEILTHMRITGGTLRAKMKLAEDQKVDQIRRYSGRNYELLDHADAGMIVSVKGLHDFVPGQGIGMEKDAQKPILSPCMKYEILVDETADELALQRACRLIAQQDPQLSMSIDEDSGRIDVELMGSMQMEVLQKKIMERTGIRVGFGPGRIVYEETIAAPVEGAGHFEPLRHYAEVHVRLQPIERGSGIIVESECRQDELSMNFQRSILEALRRKKHRGVLTGSLLSDVKITLTHGKGSVKHTEGGDFRQAACRAVRQALMKADSVLLEPFCSFQIEVPPSSLSRLLYDLQERKCSVEVKDSSSDRMTVSGKGPMRLLLNYQSELTAFTHGEGRYQSEFTGYERSEEQDKIVRQIAYNPDEDLRNPSGSIFCSHGAGYFVPWNEADEKMDLQTSEEKETAAVQHHAQRIDEEEVKRVFEMTSGRNRNEKKRERPMKKTLEEEKKAKPVKIPDLPRCLIVDGYNMVFSWESTKQLAREDIGLAREKVIDLLFNYQPILKGKIVIVFDGYRVKDNIGTQYSRGEVTVIYTKHDETADAWIERAGYELKGKYALTVATSDGLIQNAVFSQGALRMSARELEEIILAGRHGFEI